jgi:DNA polymerase I-like protein with 3'-5' exonuclease and polymerase domains
MNMFPPESFWTPPEIFPDLSKAKIIAIDLETRDPNLKTLGPGGVRNDGEIVGVAIATDTGFSGYYPVGHLSGGNLDRDIVFGWLRDELKRSTATVVGANILYDLEWLACDAGIVLGSNTIHDIQIMEGLLDEEGRYSLDALSRKYLGITKEENLLNEAAASFGVDPKAGLWKLHSKYVGPYGEGDAANTIGVYKKQLPLLEAEGLSGIFALESAVTPIVLKMRLNGVRVDIEKAEALDAKLMADYKEELLSIERAVGFEVNPWAQDHLARICGKRGVQVARTAAGNPSFTKEWLEHQVDPVFRSIVKARTVDRLRGTFIKEKIINVSYKGRIHAQFHQMRGDEDGTRTGRFSSSNPNLQQVPSRDKLAPLIRGLFIPEDGESWCKLDYSQQEPRIAVHYALACGFKGAEAARESYLRGEDFYKFITEAAGITRRQAKDLTLGRMYGMGFKKMAEKLRCSDHEATEILSAFDNGAPFLKKLSDQASRNAKNRGYIQTIGGRHRHFETYVPVGDRHSPPLKRDEAEIKWGVVPLERFGCHKALNSLIQGSAADMTKYAMVNTFNETGQIPLMQVHDELNFSLKTKDEGLAIKKICEDAVKLKVPVVCDMDWGKSWK